MQQVHISVNIVIYERIKVLMKIRHFLIESENIEQDSYLWNMTGSILTAFQSVIMLVILSRVTGLREAGILTIAYANANLFLTIGKFGMRNFQVSDVREQFSFKDYLISRWITVGLMVVMSVLYVLYAQFKNDYSLEKTLVIIWMCLLKTIEAAEDIFHGYYQQRDRLDIAGKAMTLRMLFTIIVFGVGVILLKDLLLALVISTISSFLVFLMFTKWTYNYFRGDSKKAGIRRVILLLKLCLPLFIGSFLSAYIANVPKYAIDSILDDESQACYGFIAMPVFVIELLSGFVFNPILHEMSIIWRDEKTKDFIIKIARQIRIIGIITLGCVTGAFICGIPLLSWFYNTDLSAYKTELLVLLLGGGFRALSVFFGIMNTVIRQQNKLLFGYITISVLGSLVSHRLVELFEVLGAATLYTSLMGILCFIFGGILLYCILKRRNN